MKIYWVAPRMENYIGPFHDRRSAEQALVALCAKPDFRGAEIKTVEVEDEEEDK